MKCCVVKFLILMSCTFLDVYVLLMTNVPKKISLLYGVENVFFIGYPNGNKGKSLYNLDSEDIIISRDFKFHENEFPFVSDSDSSLMSHVANPSMVDLGFLMMRVLPPLLRLRHLHYPRFVPSPESPTAASSNTKVVAPSTAALKPPPEELRHGFCAKKTYVLLRDFATNFVQYWIHL